MGTQQAAERGQVVAHTLRGEGFDASEDGTGRGTPLVAVSLRADASRDGRARTPSADAEGRVRLRDPGFSVEVERTAFTEDDSTGALAGTMDRSRGGMVLTPFDTTLAAGAHPPAVAYAADVSPTLNASAAGTSRPGGPGLASEELYHPVSPVPRRLTPVECERLQGFPDDWTRYGRKPDGEVYEQADSPRYRQLGNAVSVPVAKWIGQRIMEFSMNQY